LLRVLAFASPCPHLETASAVLDDGPALTNGDRRSAGTASVVVDADCRDAAEQSSTFRKKPATV
jgi:hypothetical protein